MVVNGLAFPTGDERTSAVMLHQVMPSEVRAGQPYDYEIHVTNLTTANLQNVVVTSESLQNLLIDSATPAQSRSAGGAPQWVLGDLGPCKTQVIRVKGRASSVGTASNCLSVAYNNSLCSQVLVVQPALQLVKTGPAEAMLCDVITYRVEVKNTGTGAAEGVRIRENLPAGMTTTDGKNSVDIEVGSLAAGQSRAFNIAAKATKSGRFENVASAVSAGGLTAESGKVTTVVRQPVLELTSRCPEGVFVGRNLSYEFTVKNAGDGPAASTVLSAGMPSGATFVSSTMNGTASANSVNWNLGTIPAGESRTVSLVVRPGSIGDYRVNATANAACATQVTRACDAAVRGIPAILLEVVDTEDPIEVGNSVTYVIEVTNQGSAPDTNIKIVCELPEEMSFVSATGATAGTAQGRRITFAPLASLAPGAKATWRVVAKADREGNVRFRTSLTSDNFERPIEETEATNLFR